MHKMIENKQVINYYLPLFFFIVNFLLKVVYLDYRDINLDEAFTIFNSQKSLSDLIGIFVNENNPPFHFILTHFIIKLTGISVFGLRFSSLIFSCLTVVVIYFISIRYFNLQVALLSSLIFTFSTFHVLFSHEVRVYSLFSLLTALIIFYLFAIINDPGKVRNYFLLGLFNIVLIYSHYLGFILLLIELGVIIVFRHAFTFKKRMILLLLLTFLSFLPILLIFLTRLGSFFSEGTWVSTPSITEVYGNINRFLNNRLSSAILAFLVFSGVLILFKKKTLGNQISRFISDKRIQILLFIFGTSYFGMFVISIMGYPVFLDRYILFTTVPLFLIIPLVLYYFTPNKKIFYSFSLIFILSMLIYFDINPDNNRKVKDLVTYVKLHKNHNTPIIICPDYFDVNFLFYYDRTAFSDFRNKEDYLKHQMILPLNNAREIGSEHLKFERIIFIDAAAEFSYPGNNIKSTLIQQFEFQKGQYFVEDLTVTIFSRRMIQVE